MTLEWVFDNAASGPRERAWVRVAGRPVAEAVVYLEGPFAGRWWVHVYPSVDTARGKESDPETAKRRATLVLEALTSVL